MRSILNGRNGRRMTPGSYGVSGSAIPRRDCLQRYRLAKCTTMNIKFFACKEFLLGIRLSVFRGRVGVEGVVEGVCGGVGAAVVLLCEGWGGGCGVGKKKN